MAYTKLIKTFTNSDEFNWHVQNEDSPCVLTDSDIGPCKELWTKEYLINKLSGKTVQIHQSNQSNLDFVHKNFTYSTMQFEDFLSKAFQDSSNAQDSFYYLRAIGANPRTDVARLSKDFPEIANDLNMPPVCSGDNIFSEVLRISSNKIRIWTHYDVLDNVLIQIYGTKRCVLFAPSDLLNLYMIGDKSLITDIDNPDYNKFPDFKKAVKYTIDLNPGDILHIPALWLHNIVCLTPSISVNVFWKSLDESVYDKKDIYGNKDLIPAQKNFQSLESSVRNLKKLPLKYQDFYIRRLISNLEVKLSLINDK